MTMKNDDYCDISAGARGQKIVRVSGRDDSSSGAPNGGKESMNGAKMGGSATNLSHSLSGASAVQHVKGE